MVVEPKGFAFHPYTCRGYFERGADAGNPESTAKKCQKAIGGSHFFLHYFLFA